MVLWKQRLVQLYRFSQQLPCFPRTLSKFDAVSGTQWTMTFQMTFLNKSSQSPHLAKAQHSVPSLSVRDPGPMPLPRVSASHAREGSIRVHTYLKRDLQPPGHCGAGAPLLKREELEEIENPHGALWNPPAPRKSGLMKSLRGFLLQHGFGK